MVLRGELSINSSVLPVFILPALPIRLPVKPFAMPKLDRSVVLGSSFCRQKDVIFARIDRKKKVPATVIIRAATAFPDKQIISELGDFIQSTLNADTTKTQEESLLEFYRKLRPGEPVVLENAQKFFQERFFDLRTYELGNVGRHKVNKNLVLISVILIKPIGF